MTEQLLEVAKGSLSALMKLGHDSVNLLPMTCLHLMTVSALLSRCPRPSQDQWSNLGISKKQSKKENGEGLKHMMVNAVQAFHEHLEGVSDKASSFQQWSQAGFSEGERSKRMEDFSRASFCEVIVIIFTILSEVFVRLFRVNSFLSFLFFSPPTWVNCLRTGLCLIQHIPKRIHLANFAIKQHGNQHKYNIVLF